MADNELVEVEPRPFGEFLADQRGGDCHHEATQKLHQLIEAVSETGRPGKITLIFSVKPAARGARMVAVTDDVKLTLPELERDTAVFYVDKNHNLSRSDPDQQDLPLRELPQRQRREVS